MSLPLIVGHRGAAGHAPENSFGSMELALQMGADWIEIDVQLSADGDLIVMHDARVDRTTDGQGELGTMTLEQLQGLQLPNGEPIPTLEQVLERLSGRCGLNIELKGEGTAAPSAALVTAQIEAGNWSAEQLLLSSFRGPELVYLHEHHPDLPIALLTEADVSFGLEFASQMLAARSLNVHHKLVDAQLLQDCHELGMQLQVYTINDVQQMQQMIDLGLDAIITDYPDRLRDLLVGQS